MHVVIIGAGLAGIACARQLAPAGHQVTVLDKGRSVGGRMATRRIGNATLDTGAQFFTVRSDPFAALVHDWVGDGAAAVWHHGFAGSEDGYPRYRGTPSMNGIVKHFAAPLHDVRCSATVRHVEPGIVELEDETSIAADAIVITAPVRQSAVFLERSGIELPDWAGNMAYWPTLALLAVLDGPSAVPPPGGVQDADETFHIVVDNMHKGVSSATALTMHVRDEISEARWGEDHDAVHRDLLAAAQPWFGSSKVITSEVKRWRYATPKTIWPEPFLAVADGHILLAGDAFAGPRIEGALLSGWAAAELLLS
jgi:renalase